jgi:hypothetical protein
MENDMCLSFKVRTPERVLAEGIHKGFEWAIVHNNYGYRCGYVKVTSEHPWYRKGYNIIGVKVHGGLTFSEADIPCGGDDNGWWVGFDCAHSFDAPDSNLPSTSLSFISQSARAEIRTQEYVLAECHSLCEQAASKMIA